MDTRADQKRQVRRRTNLLDLLEGGAVARALAGGDDGVGIEKCEIARQLVNATVGGDRVRAMLDVAVGKDLDMFGPQQRTIAHRFGRAAFHETFIGHIGIGPLVDADELCPARHGDGEGGNGSICQHVDADGHAGGTNDAVCHHAHEGRCFRPDIVGLGERDVSVVFDDQSVHAALDKPFRITHAGIIDRIHARAAITRRAGKGGAMYHADQRLASTENFLNGIGRVVGYGLHFCPFRKFCMRAFVIGNIALDETYSISALPEAGASIFGAQASRSLGGKGCNQAIVLARCGVETTLVAAIGTDERAVAIRTALARERLRPQLAAVDGPSDISIILTTPDGENSIITTRSAASALGEAAATGALRDAVAGDLAVLQGNLSEKTTLAILEAAKSRGMVTAFNPSPLQPWFAGLWPLIDVAFLNRIEAEELTGESGTRAGAVLLSAGVGRVVVTLGGEGSLLVSEAGTLTVPATPATIIDTTGAGDCFTGVALASASLRGVPVDERSLRHASRAAAITVGRRGTQDAFPNIEELASIVRT